jgi:hypothetical protein
MVAVFRQPVVGFLAAVCEEHELDSPDPVDLDQAAGGAANRLRLLISEDGDEELILFVNELSLGFCS